MGDGVAGWEAELCAAYRVEIDLYTRAAVVARDLPAAFPHGQQAEESAQKIVHYLDEVALIEARIAETKSGWLITHGKPGPEFKSILAQVTRSIVELAEQMKIAERAAQARKAFLSPALDMGIRALQMQHAYGGVMALNARRS
jgi:hypothetical protein